MGRKCMRCILSFLFRFRFEACLLSISHFPVATVLYFQVDHAQISILIWVFSFWSCLFLLCFSVLSPSGLGRHLKEYLLHNEAQMKENWGLLWLSQFLHISVREWDESIFSQMKYQTFSFGRYWKKLQN